jgi:hypothetical protein
MAKEKKTQETRKCLNEGLSKSIRELVAQDPEEVVRHLMVSDMGYWEAVKKEIVYPMLESGTNFGQKIRDKNIDKDDIYSRLYEKMVFQGKLKALKNKKYVIDFIIQYVRAIVSSFFERKTSKKPVVISINAGGDDETGLSIDIPEPKPPSVSYEEWELREKVQKEFNILWQRNPRRALVLLLRYVKGLSAREVKNFLNVATENYVNQVASIAKNDLRASALSVVEAIQGR